MKEKKLKLVIFFGNNEICKKADKFVSKLYVKTLKVFHNEKIPTKKIIKFNPDLIVSFMNLKKIPPELLKFVNFNIHTALPKYPGRGGASLAIFNEDEYYGSTAHVMTKKIDNGEIIKIKKKKLDKSYDCETLYKKTTSLCFSLLTDLCIYFEKNQKLPIPKKKYEWGKYMSKEKFQKWLVLDPKKKVDFIKKIKASKHSQFPGPYVTVNGYKFSLITEADEK